MAENGDLLREQQASGPHLNMRPASCLSIVFHSSLRTGGYYMKLWDTNYVPGLDAYWKKITETRKQKFKNWCGCRDEKSTETRDHSRCKEIWSSLPIPTFHQHIHVVLWSEELVAMYVHICWWNVGMGRELQISLHPEWSSVLFSSLHPHQFLNSCNNKCTKTKCGKQGQRSQNAYTCTSKSCVECCRSHPLNRNELVAIHTYWHNVL